MVTSVSPGDHLGQVAIAQSRRGGCGAGASCHHAAGRRTSIQPWLAAGVISNSATLSSCGAAGRRRPRHRGQRGPATFDKALPRRRKPSGVVTLPWLLGRQRAACRSPGALSGADVRRQAARPAAAPRRPGQRRRWRAGGIAASRACGLLDGGASTRAAGRRPSRRSGSGAYAGAG